jgi:hypothetical protein
MSYPQHQFNGPGGAKSDFLHIDRIEDNEHGTVLWLQSGIDGCYIPIDQLDDLIAVLKRAAA